MDYADYGLIRLSAMTSSITLANPHANVEEILHIQSTGLARRLVAPEAEKLVLGLSGGLDSTLAFLVCLDALSKLGRPMEDLLTLTVPGPGTSFHTYESVQLLCQAVSSKLEEVQISDSAMRHLVDLGYNGPRT